MDESLDLALGLSPVRAAQSRQKAVVMGKVAEPGPKPVLAQAIRITADCHVRMLLYSTSSAMLPMKANAASWHAINVSSRSSVTNCT
jgi:hypothetical protein